MCEGVGCTTLQPEPATVETPRFFVRDFGIVPWSRNKCETPVSTRTRPVKKRIPRSRGTEQCESRSRINTSRGGHIPYKQCEVPFNPGVIESRGISSWSRKVVPRNALVNPFRTAVPFWGQTSQIISNMSPKRDCSLRRVAPLLF